MSSSKHEMSVPQDDVPMKASPGFDDRSDVTSVGSRGGGASAPSWPSTDHDEETADRNVGRPRESRTKQKRRREVVQHRSTPRNGAVFVSSFGCCDMGAVDETAAYLANRWGCGASGLTHVDACAVCDFMDMSDVPLLS